MAAIHGIIGRKLELEIFGYRFQKRVVFIPKFRLGEAKKVRM